MEGAVGDAAAAAAGGRPLPCGKKWGGNGRGRRGLSPRGRGEEVARMVMKVGTREGWEVARRENRGGRQLGVHRHTPRTVLAAKLPHHCIPSLGISWGREFVFR